MGYKAHLKKDMIKKVSIENRLTLRKLVYAFYDKVHTNEELAPIFNQVIAPDEWEAHLEKMIDFWESNLFLKPLYKGNPPQIHIDVDNKVGNSINKKHFTCWLKLWKATIDENFEGALALEAKKKAEHIARVLLIKILSARGELQRSQLI